MTDPTAQSRALFLFPDSSEIRYMAKPPTIGLRIRREQGDLWTVVNVLKSGIDTYTVTCVASPKGALDLVADLLEGARNSISLSRRRAKPRIDQHVTHGIEWVALPPYVPFVSDAFVNPQATSETHSDNGADRREHENTPIDALASQQLSAIARVSDLFGNDGDLFGDGIDYWLFGGWAVDFYAGAVTRAHDDVDIAVWLEDVPRIAKLLEEDGWRHAPLADEDGGTGYERGSVRLELTYLVRDAGGVIFTPLRRGRGQWSEDALADDVRELHGVHSRLVGLGPLTRAKSSPRDDPEDAAKDRADFEQLSR